jgi:hypothetical protein
MGPHRFFDAAQEALALAAEHVRVAGAAVL